MESGQREYRQEISCILCSVLEYAGFSESIRKFRTELYEQASTELSKKNEYQHLVITGSRAEGVGLPYSSDLDLLVICEDVICLSSHDTHEHFTTLKASESPKTPTGYVTVTATNFANHLGLTKVVEWSLVYQDSDSYPLVSSAIFRNYTGQCLAAFPAAGYDFMVSEFAGTNGPASTLNIKLGLNNHSVDYVQAIYYFESTHLSKWSSRNAFRCWPCSDMIKEVSTTEGYIVPVGSLEGCLTNVEWRVSYVTAENKLVQYFNQSQYKLYIMLKMITKEQIKPDFPGVSSYVIKNVVLWVCELSPASFFRQELLLEQIAKCLKFIKICVYNNHLPNYFIPKKNLLASRMEASSKPNLITRLNYLIDHGNSIYCRLQTFTKHSFLLTYGPSMKEAYGNIRDEIEKCNLTISLSVIKKFILSDATWSSPMPDLLLNPFQDINAAAAMVKLIFLVVPEWKDLFPDFLLIDCVFKMRLNYFID